VQGSLDALAVRMLRELAEELLTHDGDVVLDLSQLSLIDGQGVAELVSLRRRLHARGSSLRLVGAHSQPLAMLRLLRLDGLVDQPR
jgi:anti-anti-sigma factor